jgi:imidazolonepropionase-like amidohydrolase
VSALGVGDAISGVAGGLLLGVAGTFAPGRSLGIVHGRFGPAAPVGGPVLDATGWWVTPGFVDAHSHLSWSDYDAADRSPADEERAAATAANQLATLRTGVTAVRDAGGYDPALRRRIAGRPGPRVWLSVDILGPADALGERHLRNRVAALADAGASWIKVAATSGVGAGDRQLEPVFTPGEFAAIVAAATAAGLPVMAHAWGGPAVDRAIDLGVASIEHGVFLTAAQAVRAAAAGVVVVPTVWIYTEVLRLASTGVLPASLVPAARRAVAAHPSAVRCCLDAGVTLAMGTDAGLASQHGRNLHEVAAMIDVGVPAAVALAAATSGGVRLLQGVADPLAPGQPADLVCFDRDPGDPATLRSSDAVVAVVQAGRLAWLHRPS